MVNNQIANLVDFLKVILAHEKCDLFYLNMWIKLIWIYDTCHSLEVDIKHLSLCIVYVIK